MRILISNDDGIRASGIHTLARALSKEHEIHVYAPTEERSGVGHAFTFLHPLRLVPVEMDKFAMYAVSGTPVDCVKLGCYHMGGLPDVVVSGINRGGNLGTDVLYSGTVSAALEGVLLGVSALAVSCNGQSEPMNYEASAHYASRVLEYMQKCPLPKEVMLNLNVPDLPLEQIKGLRVTRVGWRRYENHYEARKDPRGNDYYWLCDRAIAGEDADSDVFWIQQGYATLSPIRPDVSDENYLQIMRAHRYFE